MIDRFEGAGLGVAITIHAALVALFFLVPKAAEPPPPLNPRYDPIEVSITDETGLETAAPEVSTEVPAAAQGETEQPPEPNAQPEPATEPQPAPKPEPARELADRKPPPKPAAQPAAKPAPAKPREVKPSGNIRDPRETDGPARQPTTGTSTKPPGAVSGPVLASLLAQIRMMVKPNWKAPTGADIDKLQTYVRIQLNLDGTLKEVTFVQQKGKTDLNRAQQELHKERAIAAVRRTRWDTNILKPEYYSVWGDFITFFGKW